MSTVRFLQQENRRLQQENEVLEKKVQSLARHLERIKELHWATHHIITEENKTGLLDQLLGDTLQVIDASDGSLLYLDEGAEELVFILARGDIGQQLGGYRFKHDVGIAGWVVANYEPIIVNHPRQDWRFSVMVDETFGFITRSIVTVPVIDQRKLLGVIQCLNKRQGLFDEADVAVLLSLSQVAAIVLKEMAL